MTIRLNGSTSGYTEIDAPAVAGAGVLTLPTGTGTLLTAEGGKVLQIVRATDATTRSTTSATYVDASISVTITPKKSTSAIIVIWSAYSAHLTTAGYNQFRITDSSNVALSGAENMYEGSSTTANFNSALTVIGYATPGVTTAVTYKGRFLASLAGSNVLDNASNTGQIYAIEVSA